LLTPACVSLAGWLVLSLQPALGFLKALPGRIPLPYLLGCQVRQRFGQRRPAAAFSENSLDLRWTEGPIVQGCLANGTGQPGFAPALMPTPDGDSGIAGEESHQRGDLIGFSIWLTIAVESHSPVC
jgi:hypothetical protein